MMDPRNRVEWVILGISAVAVAGIIGFLIIDAATDAGEPAAPVVRLLRDSAHETPTGWLLPAVVVNEGDQSAQALLLVATATVEGASEDAEVMVDYLPAGSKVEVTFGFSGRPAGDIEVRVVGFVR